MRFVSKYLKWLMSGGNLLASIFLLIVMLVITVNVIMRLWGGGVRGTYEMVQIFIVAPISFAIVATEVARSHVTMSLISSRLTPRVKSGTHIFGSLIGIVYWGLLAWVAFGAAQEGGLAEITNLLLIPYLPFRICFILGTLAMSLLSIYSLWNAFKGVSKKWTP